MTATDVTTQIDAHQTQHLDRVRAFIRQPSISADGTGIPAMARRPRAHSKRIRHG